METLAAAATPVPNLIPAAALAPVTASDLSMPAVIIQVTPAHENKPAF
jgi:hypothetical protein